jgi:AcrR family transcriptional regulator
MSRPKESDGSDTVRERILNAAFEAFMERGYAATSTLEIATRARVSKRELYALVGNKQKMLIAAIGERAKRFKAPADMPMLRDRATVARVLRAFGTQLVREVTDPTVVGVFRLAIAEAIQARVAGLIDGSPADLAEQFAGLLWRDLLISLLLGVAQRPNLRAIEARARDAAEAFLRLHSTS